MRRRLDLAASLVGRPDVLFLDEPTTGLDPRSRIDVWEFIRELQNEGTTLLLTTQYLDEADQLADRIAVIDVGTVIAEGTSDELKDRIGGEVLELHVEDRADIAGVVQALAGVGSGETSSPMTTRAGYGSPWATRDPTALLESVRRLDEAEDRARRHRPAPTDARRRVPVAHGQAVPRTERPRAHARRSAEEEARPTSAGGRDERHRHFDPAPGAAPRTSAAGSRSRSVTASSSPGGTSSRSPACPPCSSSSSSSRSCSCCCSGSSTPTSSRPCRRAWTTCSS